MKKFIHIDSIFREIRSRGVRDWTDSLTFPRIFIIWIIIVLLFGFAYFSLTSDYSYLRHNVEGSRVDDTLNSIYFSFITATTTGFGDIIPMGWFKFISILEVVFGMLLLAVVTSKLVSIKQNIILNEVYELSFNEKLNRLRSSLLLFRQNISRLISKIEEGSVLKREIKDIHIQISQFEDCLTEIIQITGRQEKNHFIKNMGPVDSELIYNSVLSSFEKLNELIIIMNEEKIEWKRDMTLRMIERCISLNETIYEKLKTSKAMIDSKIQDIKARKDKAVEMIKAGCEKRPEAQQG